ncbi:hypothetical protein HN011_000598 [Eciton burchellii]|nr:hypothetical protein HN011_000598 [Eciton burchellii]
MKNQTSPNLLDGLQNVAAKIGHQHRGRTDSPYKIEHTELQEDEEEEGRTCVRPIMTHVIETGTEMRTLSSITGNTLRYRESPKPVLQNVARRESWTSISRKIQDVAL